ncbi:MAG: hypothetical protein U1F42_08915 [Candidatus Competibacteraceae bacterium]
MPPWQPRCGQSRAVSAIGLNRAERVAVYLPKQPETVSALFGAVLAGGVFVPVTHC